MRRLARIATSIWRFTIVGSPFLILATMTAQNLFETRRLRVRRMSSDDYDMLLVVYGDPEAMRWVDDGEPISEDDAARWIGVTLRNYETRGYGMCAVELAATNEVVGFCGLVHPGGQEAAELKYALRREHWGKGLATEAARGMVRYGTEEFGLDEIIATVAPENAASQNVLAKAGFRAAEVQANEDGTQTAVFRWRPDQ